MCGLIGYSGQDVFDSDKIKILMLANIERGKDACGFYNNGLITKDIVTPAELLSKHKLIPENIFIGHDRAATIGSRTKDNSHPFHIENIIGAHNGTLTNHHALARDLDLKYNDWDVDSEVLFYGIQKSPREFKILKEFKGAAALIWTDTNHPNRIYCFRNSERPLFRGMIGDNMYISSMDNSLELIGATKIKMFKTDYLYCIENGSVLNHESKIIKQIVLKNEKTLPVSTRDLTTNNAGVQNIGARSANNDPKYKDGDEVDIYPSVWYKRLDITGYSSNSLIKSGTWVTGPKSLMANQLSMNIEVFDPATRSWQVYSTATSLYQHSGHFVKHSFAMAMASDNKSGIKEGDVILIEGIEWLDNEMTISYQGVNSNVIFLWGVENFRPLLEEELKSLSDDGMKFMIKVPNSEINKAIPNPPMEYHDAIEISFLNQDFNEETEKELDKIAPRNCFSYPSYDLENEDEDTPVDTYSNTPIEDGVIIEEENNIKKNIDYNYNFMEEDQINEFENIDELKDEEGNSLGDLYIQIASIYDDLKGVKVLLNNLITKLNKENIISSESENFLALLSVLESIHKIQASIFDQCYSNAEVWRKVRDL
jgi:hypothetical protein